MSDEVRVETDGSRDPMASSPLQLEDVYQILTLVHDRWLIATHDELATNGWC